MGAQDAVLQVFQLLGNVAFPVGQRLFANVVLGYLIFIGVGDLDVIAEHPIVAGFQLGNAGALLLPGLHRGDKLFAAVHIPLDLVQLGVVPLPDDAPFSDGKGRLLHDGRVDELGHVLQPVDLVVEVFQQGGLTARQNLFQPGQAAHCRAQGAELPAVGRAVDDAGHNALQVVDAGELLRRLVQQLGVIHQLRYGVLPQGDLGRAQKGLLQPGLDEALPHGGLGLVQHPQQGTPLLLVPQGLGEFQVPPGI